MSIPKCVQDKMVKFASPEETFDGVLEDKVVSPKSFMIAFKRALEAYGPTKLRCTASTSSSTPSPNDEGEYMEDEGPSDIDILQEEIQALKDEIANIKLDMLQ